MERRRADNRRQSSLASGTARFDSVSLARETARFDSVSLARGTARFDREHA